MVKLASWTLAGFNIVVKMIFDYKKSNVDMPGSLVRTGFSILL